MYSKEHIATRLKAFLEEKQISFNQAGKETDTSGTQISNIVAGKNYTIDVLLKVLNTYPDLSVGYLFEGKADGKSKVIYKDPNPELVKRNNELTEKVMQLQSKLLEMYEDFRKAVG